MSVTKYTNRAQAQNGQFDELPMAPTGKSAEDEEEEGMSRAFRICAPSFVQMS